MKKLFFLTVLLGFSWATQAQVEAEEEDDIDYGAVELVDGGRSKTFANSRISGTSPQRFVNVGWDVQAPYDMTFSPIGSFAEDSAFAVGQQATGRAQYTGGFRFNANIPVISRNNLVWQMGATYWDTRYNISNIAGDSLATGKQVLNALNENGIRTGGINTTIYKPFDEYQFILVQASADMSGDYGLGLQREVRTSVAVLWGKRPNDRKQWAVGLSRTYRVGAMNYIPIFLYNWTASNRKWGVEALLPARGAVRYNINRKSLLLAGFELEGQSYRLNALSETLYAANNGSLEIRRGELRPRLEYMRQLTGYFWLGVQAGYRLNFSYHADQLPSGKEFFRGFVGDQKFAMLNSIGNAPYAQITINFVSP